jgi:hypothetical protein
LTTPPIDRDLELAAEASVVDFWLGGEVARSRECGAIAAEVIDLDAPADLAVDPHALTLRWAPSPARLVIEAASASVEIPAAALGAVAGVLELLAAAAPLPRPDDEPTPLAATELAFAAGAARELAQRTRGNW